VKIALAAIGRLKETYLVEAERDYVKRLRRYCTLTVQEFEDEPALLRAAPADSHLYAFDERGETLTSAQFAELLAREASHGGGAPIVLAIGGADGHTEAVRKRARKLIAFGRLTIAHRLVRILVLEQLYRAFKITRGEPYHRD
jgi:23S rRNA (pseudouridine1915-N3)-methyltransferase